MKSKKELESIARMIRKDIYKMALNSGTKGAHIGGSLSATEILSVLYGDVMKLDSSNPQWDKRDRFIMSKAHSAIGLYAALHYAGFLTDEDIEGAMQGESFLFKHPKMNIDRGFEFSSGSLGHGLALGVGSVLGMKRRGNTSSQVYVLLGDGECDEGSIWEAAASITHFGLKQITVIIDVNGLQNDGSTIDVMNKGNIEERWRSLGFDTVTIDGHDVTAIQSALCLDTKKPKVIIAHTVKGKGISFAENNHEWHIGYFTKDMYDQAMKELD